MEWVDTGVDLEVRNKSEQSEEGCRTTRQGGTEVRLDKTWRPEPKDEDR